METTHIDAGVVIEGLLREVADLTRRAVVAEALCAKLSAAASPVEGGDVQ